MDEAVESLDVELALVRDDVAVHRRQVAEVGLRWLGRRAELPVDLPLALARRAHRTLARTRRLARRHETRGAKPVDLKRTVDLARLAEQRGRDEPGLGRIACAVELLEVVHRPLGDGAGSSLELPV